MKVLGSAVVCFLLAVPILANGQTANEMLANCKSIASAPHDSTGFPRGFPHTFETGLCWGAFSTLANTIRWSNAKYQQPPFAKSLPSVCAWMPAIDELMFVFVTYAKAHPKRLQEPFFPVVLDSFHKAYSCDSGHR